MTPTIRPAAENRRPRLSNVAARRLFLDRHGLGESPSGRMTTADLLGLVERLGFVQVDSINTVARAQHMILFARRHGYRPKHLRRLLERERALFEHWTHDAAVIPTRFYPYWRRRFEQDAERLRTRWRSWQANGFEERFDDVLAHVRENGAVRARDVGNGESKGSGGWWEWHPSKTALEYLWRTGELAVCRREGFQKVYDLSERVIPEWHRVRRPEESEVIDWACASALDRLGFATPAEIASFWDAVTLAEAKDWCRERLGEDLVEIDVEGACGTAVRRAFARPDVLRAAADAPEPPDRVRILSPFDPAIRDRRRAERLFGFRYRIEVFVPASRRLYGYYVFPILERDRLIGRIDMRCRRDDDTLEVAALWPEANVTFGKRRRARLESQLVRVARFSDCAQLRFADGWLREPGPPPPAFG